jgi:hypothetical protein
MLSYLVRKTILYTSNPMGLIHLKDEARCAGNRGLVEVLMQSSNRHDEMHKMRDDHRKIVLITKQGEQHLRYQLTDSS